MSKKSKKTTIGRGRALTQFQREMIIQAYALCGNKAQVAREIGCGKSTVHKVVKQAQSDKALQKARTSALEDVAGQVHGKAVEIIESIGEQDLESGLIKNYGDKDDPDRLTSVKAYGPSLLQKVTSAAILTDKLKVIEETKQAVLADGGGGEGGLPLPGTIQESLRLLGQKIKKLRIIDVQFDSKHEDTVSKVQETAHAAELHKDVDEADYEDLSPPDFDNP